ncbi:MAG: hypothetical protein ABIP49_06400 [Lysobacterales bacterium]
MNAAGWGLFAVLMVGSLPVAAQDPGSGRISNWYVGARQGIVASNRELRRDGDITSLQFGRRLGDEQAYEIELEIAQDRLDFGIDYGLKHRSAQINLLMVNREPLWDPYFLIGVGAIEFDSPVGARRGTDPLVAFGIGGTWELVIPQRVLLRADLRVRYDLNDTGQPGEDSRGDGILSIGFVIPFR